MVSKNMIVVTKYITQSLLSLQYNFNQSKDEISLFFLFFLGGGVCKKTTFL